MFAAAFALALSAYLRPMSAGPARLHFRFMEPDRKRKHSQIPHYEVCSTAFHL